MKKRTLEQWKELVKKENPNISDRICFEHRRGICIASHSVSTGSNKTKITKIIIATYH